MGADLFRTLHVSFHCLRKLLISLIFSGHKATMSLIPSRYVPSCIKVWINTHLEKILLLDYSEWWKTDFPFAVTNKCFQSITHSVQVGRHDSDTIDCLLGKRSVSKAPFFPSSFSFFSTDLPFFQKGEGEGRNFHSRKLCKSGFILFRPVLRKRTKACRIVSVWECWKTKLRPTLALPYTT